MKKIRCIIIDDEAANLNMLKNMLAKHCPSIVIPDFSRSAKEEDTNNVIYFIHNPDGKNQLLKSIPLHSQDKVHMVDIDDICYVQALRGYSEIVTTANQRFLSAKVLSDYEDLLSPFTNFLRVNKSMLINIRYIKDYSKGATCFINIKNGDSEIEVSRRKKTDIIQYLRVMQ